MKISKFISWLTNKHILSLGGNVIMSVFTIVSMSILYRFLPNKVEIGNWVFFQTTFALVEMFRAGFLTTAAIKFYSGTEENRAAEVIGSTWVLGTLITAALLLLNIPALFIVKHIHTEGLAFFLKWFGLTYLLTLPTIVANCVLQAEGRFDRLLVMRAINQISFLVSIIVFILLHRLTLETVIVSNLFSSALASVYALIKGWSRISAWGKHSKSCLLELYHFGKYSVGNNISAYLLRASDVYIIMFMFTGDVGAGMVAVYKLGLSLLEVVEIPLRSFVATAIQPMAAAYNEGKKGYVIYIFKKYAGMLTIALVPVCIGAVLFAEIPVYIIGGHKMMDTEAANILRLFMTFALLFPTDRFMGLTLDVIHKPNINFYKILIMLAANIAGDFLGIALFHNLYGLAITTVFPTILAVAIGYWALGKYEPFRLRDIYVVGYKELKILIRDTLKLKRPVSL